MLVDETLAFRRRIGGHFDLNCRYWLVAAKSESKALMGYCEVGRCWSGGGRGHMGASKSKKPNHCWLGFLGL